MHHHDDLDEPFEPHVGCALYFVGAAVCVVWIIVAAVVLRMCT